ncbi:Glycoside hydrolase, family 29, subgroup [Rhodopirellula maiorica SM1]|uniref:alpha-L-fucosidase n=1 Tax=Rhodopirellula maiorica SM1 TaxID=1265738 RepID=M5RU37_9BACT|nr:alpha-L-fucosidase [Rhodopirellula maiorica]EMI22848.1 Glycoside hydrolase, family 29, subgroup [Rhodopirellula maiorica SM1]
MISRRNFITSGLAGAALATSSAVVADDTAALDADVSVPTYLQDVAEQYAVDPRGAALQWFRQAEFGLFIHYGLYSLLGRHEWVMIKEKIRVKEYEKLASRFTAENFDADFITDMALDAGMKYINLTTRHHDSFCLFDSKYTDFKSTNTPAKRDLVAEVAEQCQNKGLGFFLYYSHGRDWRHPHAPNNWGWGGSARPKYNPPESFYASGKEHDLQIYVEFMKNQITELLTHYGPIAGIWLDGFATPASRKKKMHEFKTQQLYDHIHSMQPQVLVSYKQGLLGTEDFKAPERHWKGESDVPLEICDTLQPHGWGYMKTDDGKHKTADQVMEMLATAKSMNANLLLNTGPLPDGSIHPEDLATLKEVGRRRRQG